MRLGFLSAADSGSLRKNDEFVPLFQGFHCRLDSGNIRTVPINRKSSEFLIQRADHRGFDGLLLCHGSRQDGQVAINNDPDRIGKRAVIAAHDGGTIRNILLSAHPNDRMPDTHDNQQTYA